MKSDKLRINLGMSCYTIISCSVMGEGKIENQDSFEIYHDENQIIVVVADGLGSAIYSKEGSSKIVSKKQAYSTAVLEIAFCIYPVWYLPIFFGSISCNFL